MKWALTLGSSGDIGAQVARDLAAEGWSLYLHYNTNQQRITTLSKELSTKYPKQDFLPLRANLLSEKAVNKITKNLFGLDAVIFAQGTTYYDLLIDFPSSKINEIFQMQLITPINLLQQIQPKLAQSKNGRIVFISSVYGQTGSAMEVPYSAVKGAINTFVRAYSQEVASLGITVNAIAPGAVLTQMNAKMFSAETLSQLKDEIPVGNLASPAEISYWVKVLVDEKARYMTGQTLYVTGGWLF